MTAPGHPRRPTRSCLCCPGQRGAPPGDLPGWRRRRSGACGSAQRRRRSAALPRARAPVGRAVPSVAAAPPCHIAAQQGAADSAGCLASTCRAPGGAAGRAWPSMRIPAETLRLATRLSCTLAHSPGAAQPASLSWRLRIALNSAALISEVLRQLDAWHLLRALLDRRQVLTLAEFGACSEMRRHVRAACAAAHAEHTQGSGGAGNSVRLYASVQNWGYAVVHRWGLMQGARKSAGGCDGATLHSDGCQLPCHTALAPHSGRCTCNRLRSVWQGIRRLAAGGGLRSGRASRPRALRCASEQAGPARARAAARPPG